jgi:hypothetical protein
MIMPTPMPTDDLTRLAGDISARCRLRGEFTLRSGQVSDEYFDKYLFESDLALLRRVTDRMSLLLPAETAMLGRLELGGIPLVTMLSQATGIPALFVRGVAAVLPDGAVTPCPMTRRLKVGSVLDAPLDTILRKHMAAVAAGIPQPSAACNPKCMPDSAPEVLTVTAADCWGRYASDPGALAGDALVHRDPNPTNFVVSGGRAWLVDWGWAVRGPVWLTAAMLVLSLMEAGWEAGAAEQAVAPVPGWDAAPPGAVRVFADAHVRMWDEATAAAPGWPRDFRASVARRWADHRAGLTGSRM